jgi:nucleotide-binding universal stress UspA family protein
MFKNIVVGVDGNEGGNDAIALARKLATDYAEITLVHIAPVTDIHGLHLVSDVADEDRDRAMLAAARRKAGIRDARLSRMSATTVGRGLHQAAEFRGADLLVVGSSRRGVIGRVLLGNDTHAALNGAPCAIAIAPASYAQQPQLIREIGVAYNGSVESEHALEVARTLASETGAKLSAFEAIALPALAFPVGPAPLDEMIEDMIEDARTRVASLDGVEPHAAYGNAAEELTIYSASLDLLVVGSRDYGPIGRLVHGSTSHELARSARCPLLVLTRAARAADAGDTALEDPTKVPADA